MAAETKARKGDGENVGLQRSETRQMGAEGEGWVCGREGWVLLKIPRRDTGGVGEGK